MNFDWSRVSGALKVFFYLVALAVIIAGVLSEDPTSAGGAVVPLLIALVLPGKKKVPKADTDAPSQ